MDIFKHGYYTLPISFRECEIISHPKIKKLLNKYNEYNLLMLLEHKKNNSNHMVAGTILVLVELWTRNHLLSP